jgi:hypothetical protein
MLWTLGIIKYELQSSWSNGEALPCIKNCSVKQ